MVEITLGSIGTVATLMQAMEIVLTKQPVQSMREQ